MADSDLAVAAAYADGLAFRPTARGARHGSGPPQQQQYHAYSNQSEDGGELPTVDDLEIAAAAAASALEDAAEDMSRTAGSMDSSEAESDSEAEEATTSSDIIPETDKEPAYTRRSTEHEVETRADVGIRPAVRVDLELVHGSAVRIHLSESLGGGGPPGAGLAGTIGGADGSEPMDSSSDSDVGGLEEMRAELDRLVRADSGEDPPERAEMLAPVRPLDVSIQPSDVLLPCGNIASIIEDMIVVQASGGMRTLAEGSVLALGDRGGLGRIEDVLGPVASPLYALRYAGPRAKLARPGLEQTGQEEASPILSSAPAQRVVQAKLPEGIVPGASVFAVEQHVQYISPEELQGKGYDVPLEAGSAGVEAEDDPDEFEFSDDEKEADFRRLQKRKSIDAGPAGRGRQTARQLAHDASMSSCSPGGDSRANGAHVVPAHVGRQQGGLWGRGRAGTTWQPGHSKGSKRGSGRAGQSPRCQGYGGRHQAGSPSQPSHASWQNHGNQSSPLTPPPGPRPPPGGPTAGYWPSPPGPRPPGLHSPLPSSPQAVYMSNAPPQFSPSQQAPYPANLQSPLALPPMQQLFTITPQGALVPVSPMPGMQSPFGQWVPPHGTPQGQWPVPQKTHQWGLPPPQ